MFFSEALLDIFLTSKKLAISKQELYKYFLEVWRDKNYKGINIKDLRYNSKYYKKKFKGVIRELTRDSRLKGIGDELLGPSYFLNLTVKDRDPYRVICDLYPIGYLSYLSAMQLHKLIDKETESIFFSTVDRRTWRKIFLEVLDEHDYPFFIEDYDLEISDLIPRFPTEQKYLEKDLLVFTSKNLNGYELLNGLRVRQLSLLFLDMVRTPQYCGGVETVLNVFKKHSVLLMDEILEIVQKEGTNIDKARVGFIFDEMLKVKHSLLDKWKLEMEGQRGGSRKFISYLPFEPRFTATWNISLNHTILKDYGEYPADFT